MPSQLTVKCPECGAQLKLKSRASLGQTRPCPKCAVPFVLDESSNGDSYDMDLDARGAVPESDAQRPVLKRGVSSQSKSRTREPVMDLENKPLVVGLGIGGLIGVGMLLAWLIIPRGGDIPESTHVPEQVAESESDPPVPSSHPVQSGGTPPRVAEQSGHASTPAHGPAPVAAQGRINLLEHINPQDDSLGGRWERRGAALHSIGSAKVKIPVEVKGDYSVRMKFTREGDQQIMLALKAAGRRVVVVINSKGNDVHGLSTVDGRAAPDAQNPTRKAIVTEAGRSYTVEAEVKTNNNNVSIRARLDNEMLFNWRGEASQLDNGYWQIPTTIGLGSESRDGNAVVRYEELTLTMLNGQASPGRPAVTTGPSPVTPPARPSNPSPPANAPPDSPVEVSASDTIGFRNPGYGVYSDTGVPTEWGAGQNVAWKTPMPGAGSSSPIVLLNRIYLTAYSGYAQSAESPGEINGLTFHVVALDRASGQIVWNTPGRPTKRANDYSGFMQQHGYASSTLATDGQRLFAQFNNSGGFALDLNGELLWQIDLGNGTHGFGSGASPVVHGDLVIFNASVESKALIAVNRVSGQEVWRTTKTLDQSYTTPIIAAAGGSDELIVASRAGLTGFNPANGEFLWEFHAGPHTNDYACTTPVFHNGLLYGTQNRRSTLSAVRPGGRGDVSQSHKVWHAQSRYDSTVTSPVLHGGNLFWPKDGVIGIFDAASGENVVGARAEWGKLYASPIVVNGNLYVVSRFDGTYVAQATRDLQPVAHNVIEGDDSQFNASPVVHEGQLLLRSDRFLYCIGHTEAL